VQHDVELLQHIEGLIGHQLTELELDEKEVLKDITKVYKAERTARIRSLEDETKEGSRQQLVRHARQKRKA
jgi:ATP-dependent RNA helicase DDX49/DBP8